MNFVGLATIRFTVLKSCREMHFEVVLFQFLSDARFECFSSF